MNRPLVIGGIGLLALGLLSAQTAGRVDGTVVDPSGAVIKDAKVSLFLHDGTSALLTAHTTSDGVFSIGTVRPDVYDLTVEASGFASAKLENVKVDAAAETSLPPIQLKVAGSSQSVNVASESAAEVNTETIQVDRVITQNQIETLPVLDRQVSTLFETQPGVTQGGAGVVDGMRPSSTNVTFDGVNIQDNFLRGNDLTYLPNRITLDQVQEVTIGTSNLNPALGNGASQIVLVTPSGANTFHGSLYWYNRNSGFAAKDWFLDQSGVAKAPLNLNQFGGTLGGPVKKDQLFFYFNYEGYRNVNSKPADMTVLTASARQGILTYRTNTSGTSQLNVLQAANLTPDPSMTSLLNSIPLPNNHNLGDGLNTAGYEVAEPFNENRTTVSGKLDYYLSAKSVFSGSYNFNTDDTLRPDSLQGYFGGPVPVQANDNIKQLSASWRWTPTSQLTNEVRGGFNLTVIPFNLSGGQPPYYLSDSLISLPGPAPGAFPQGRSSKVFSLQDNAMYVRGKHNLYFGYQSYVLHEQPYSPNGNVVPDDLLSITTAAPFAFSVNNLPGAQSTFVGTADSLLATLAGVIGSYSQTFNVTSPHSGYVPGANLTNNLVYNTYSGYFADNYKIARGLTISAGLRYDLWTPVYETNDLFFSPVLENNSAIQTIQDPNAALNFTGSPTHPAYQVRKTNFSPNAGFAWDVFGDGKTSVRGGYSLAYFNDDALASSFFSETTNGGISATVSNPDAYLLLRNGQPSISAPAFTAPLTLAAIHKLNPMNAQAVISPNLKTPYYQQYNFGIERQLAQVLLDVRYIGNHGTDMLQGFNENQVNLNAGGFLQDFLNAQNNGFLARAAGLGFKPAYNPAVAGSRSLPVFGQMAGGGLLANPLVINDILDGAPASLAALYQVNGLSGPINFFQNPNELYGRVLANYANSTYNALQTQVRGRLTKDLQFQFSYVFSKVMTDSPETGADAPGTQGNLEDLLAANNGQLQRGRASFDLTHVFAANYIYRIPLGAGHRFLSKGLWDQVLGGWTTSAIILHQSGIPFSVVDLIGSYNFDPNTYQTAMITGTTKSQLDAVVGNRTYVTGKGVYFVSPGIISPLGQGVAPFGSPAFNGEVFFNPPPGQVGNLQLNEFSGPWDTNVNASLQKTVQVFERHSLQLRVDFYNVFNHPVFEPGPQLGVQPQNFGEATVDLNGPRLIQFGVHYHF